jgi:DNA polymerase-3 subunit alpha
MRGTGIHACGFIICRDPISDWVPVSTAEDPDFKGVKVPVTQYDGHVIESTGLIKMDFLGLKTLSELKEAVKVIKQTTGKEIDLDNIPIDDALTYKLYQEGRTIGTFQFESPGMQKYLRELHPTVFEDLIAMNALYRPGPMDYIPDVHARKNDPSLVITYDIPCMEKYLKRHLRYHGLSGAGDVALTSAGQLHARRERCPA